MKEDSAQENATPPTPVQAHRVTDDLSEKIQHAVAREPLDRVRCVRVFGNFYRCNWWAPSPSAPERNRSFDWAMLTTHCVRKSRFLLATLDAGQLIIEEVLRPEPQAALGVS
jgi:hypothetical protein